MLTALLLIIGLINSPIIIIIMAIISFIILFILVSIIYKIVKKRDLERSEWMIIILTGFLLVLFVMAYLFISWAHSASLFPYAFGHWATDENLKETNFSYIRTLKHPYNNKELELDPNEYFLPLNETILAANLSNEVYGPHKYFYYNKTEYDDFDVIAFRGSKYIEDWKSNLHVELREGTGTHSGFYGRVENEIENIRKVVNSSKLTIFTGHSFGGASAMVAGNMMLEEDKNLKIKVIPFGSPLPFDNSSYPVCKVTYNIINHDDIVPRVLGDNAYNEVDLGMRTYFSIMHNAIALLFGASQSNLKLVHDISQYQQCGKYFRIDPNRNVLIYLPTSLEKKWALSMIPFDIIFHKKHHDMEEYIENLKKIQDYHMMA